MAVAQYHRSDSIQVTDYIATQIKGFLGQQLKVSDDRSVETGPRFKYRSGQKIVYSPNKYPTTNTSDPRVKYLK